MTGGKLRSVLAALASVPHGAVVVEARYSSIFKHDRVRPVVILEGLAEALVRFPAVPIVFAETRPLAQEWTYRFFGAALAHHGEHHRVGVRHLQELVTAGPLPLREPTLAEVRAWAVDVGIRVAMKGRLRPEVWAAYGDAHTQS